MKGHYIIFDGIDGSGKTTQAKIFAERLRAEGFDVLEVSEPYEEREPGRLLRKYLKEKTHPYALFGLFLAQRFDLLAEVVKPAIEEGTFVVSSRGFPSTYVYQRKGSPGGVTAPAIMMAHDPSNLHILPDHVFIFDLPADVAMERIGKRGEEAEIFEKRELLDRFREGYLNPLYLDQGLSKRFDVINATRSVEDVAEDVWAKFVGGSNDDRWRFT